MAKQQIITKLTSRKLWVAIGAIVGIAASTLADEIKKLVDKAIGRERDVRHVD